MKKLKLTFLLTIPLFVFSCTGLDKDDAIGMYVAKNNINTIDTVWVNADGSYINIMYRKSDNSLIYRNVSTWEFSDGYIIFNDLYTDYDDKHSKTKSGYEDVLMTTMLPLEKSLGKIIIRHNPTTESKFLEKIE